MASSVNTFADFFSDAYSLVRVGRAGDAMNPDDADFVRRAFNRLLGLWNSDRRAVYSTGFTDFTLTPNHNPHTIGPTGDFVLAQRPVSIDGAQVNLGGSPAVFRKVDIVDEKWYKAQPVPALTSQFPTKLYYSPDWVDPGNSGAGLGNCYFWPVGTIAYGMRLWTRVLLTQVVDPTINFSFPPGYELALLYELGQIIAPHFGQPWTSDQDQIRSRAVATLFGNNDEEPTIETADAGLNVDKGGSVGFNWLSRSIS